MGWCWLPVHCLAEEEENDSAVNWNKSPHGLSVSELADILWVLYQRGDIEFWDSRQRGDNCPRHLPTSQIEIYSMLEQRVYRFIIAAAGVSRWERDANPNWSKFTEGVYRHTEEGGTETWSVTCVTEYRARASLKLEAQDPDNPFSIEWSSTKVEYFRPWKPFPGKHLPRGVNVAVTALQLPSTCKLLSNESIRLNRSKWRKHQNRRVKFFRWYEYSIEDHPNQPTRHF